uniref:Uncharacterized protein n=1 Tax=Rhizophora mucronata TaxID=61149 RepID=A0A2P2IPJ0_RHIMU
MPSFLGKEAAKATVIFLLLGDSHRVPAANSTGGATAAAILFFHLFQDWISLIELIFLLQVPNNPIKKPLFFFASPCPLCCCGCINSDSRSSKENWEGSHYCLV